MQDLIYNFPAASDLDAKGAATSADVKIYFKQVVAPLAPNMKSPYYQSVEMCFQPPLM